MGSTISEETERIERQILAPHATLASESKRLLGVVAVISDFWENADDIVKTVAPLKFRGNEVILFHVLDPQELKPKLKGPALFESATRFHQVMMRHVTSRQKHYPRRSDQFSAQKARRRT